MNFLEIHYSSPLLFFFQQEDLRERVTSAEEVKRYFEMSFAEDRDVSPAASACKKMDLFITWCFGDRDKQLAKLLDNCRVCLINDGFITRGDGEKLYILWMIIHQLDN